MLEKGIKLVQVRNFFNAFSFRTTKYLAFGHIRGREL